MNYKILFMLFFYFVNFEAEAGPKFLTFEKIELPVLSAKNAVKSSFKVADYVGKKIIIINFFATWCLPCREEIPYLNKLQEKFNQQQFLFIAINAGEKIELVHKFIDKTSFKYKILLDENLKLARQFKIKDLPRTYVISLAGEIVYEDHQPPSEKILQDLLP